MELCTGSKRAHTLPEIPRTPLSLKDDATLFRFVPFFDTREPKSDSDAPLTVGPIL